MSCTLLTREYLRSIGVEVGLTTQLQLPACHSNFADASRVGETLPCIEALEAQTTVHVPREAACNFATSSSAPSKSAVRKDAARRAATSHIAAKMAAATCAKLRIVALHGHAQSASRFKGKIAAVAKDAKSLAEFEFVDGPFPVPHCEHSLDKSLGAAFTWIDASRLGEGRKGVWTTYAGVEESFEMIRALDCDGIVAFSLGAAVLAACLCHPQIGPGLREKLKFVGFFSGFVPEDPALKSWIEAAAPVAGLPSFHCMGRNDEEIGIDRSETLVHKFAGAVVHRHEGGHVVPAAVRKDFKAFLASLPR